jgi:predicted aminopeptidase
VPAPAPEPHARAQRSLRAVLLGVALSCLVGCGGCSPTYVARSGWEEARILLARQSIESLLQRPELDPQTRAKLELVLSVRKFAASDLGLDVGDAYASFSIVPPGALLQVVSAAQKTKLEPYEWWFPIVGSVDYKGYFELADAQAEAARLDREGYDTYVRPSVAFSTLGWFDDPVLSSWLRADPTRIAELLIHELLHRTWYVSGETAFNESLATFVGHVGAYDYFRSHDGPEAATTQRAAAAWREALTDSKQWSAAVAELKALYKDSAREGRPADEVLAARSAIFARLQKTETGQGAAPPPSAVSPQVAAAASQPTPTPLPGEPTPSPSPAPPPGKRPVTLNNAVILANYAYMRDLTAFDRILVATGGDLRAAIARLREITKDAKDPFEAVTRAAAELPEAPSSVAERAAAGETAAGAALRTAGRRG